MLLCMNCNVVVGGGWFSLPSPVFLFRRVVGGGPPWATAANTEHHSALTWHNSSVFHHNINAGELRSLPTNVGSHWRSRPGWATVSSASRHKLEIWDEGGRATGLLLLILASSLSEIVKFQWWDMRAEHGVLTAQSPVGDRTAWLRSEPSYIQSYHLNSSAGAPCWSRHVPPSPALKMPPVGRSLKVTIRLLANWNFHPLNFSGLPRRGWCKSVTRPNWSEDCLQEERAEEDVTRRYQCPWHSGWTLDTGHWADLLSSK